MTKLRFRSYNTIAIKMKKLKLQELLKKLDREGIPITKRTFEYYQRLGLLPKPEKQVGKKGYGVYGYYDESIIELISNIFKYKDIGYTLAEIEGAINNEVMKRYNAEFKKWEFSDYTLSELHEYLKNIKKEVLRNANAENKRLIKSKGDGEFKHSLADDIAKYIEGMLGRSMMHPFRMRVLGAFISSNWKSFYETNLLKDLKWWDANEKFEKLALERILEGLRVISELLDNAAMRVAERLVASNKQSYSVRNTISYVFNELKGRVDELEELSSKVWTRLMDLKKIGADMEAKAV